MKLRPDKPWTALTAENVVRLPGQLGVYQIADAEGTIVQIGYAGGRSRLGLRSELQGELDARGAGYSFRVEINMQYMSRYLELLMLHRADTGALPRDNAASPPARLGRLSPR